MNFRSVIFIHILLTANALNILTIPTLFGQNSNNSETLILNSEIPQPSGGSFMLHQKISGDFPDKNNIAKSDLFPADGFKTIGSSFDGFDFDDNSTETAGWRFIPPDPIGAAGTDRLIAVVNVMIEARDKSGTLLWRDALQDFFSPLTPANFTFDPKVVYDHYENRFVVVTLEKVDAGSNPNAGNTSRILVAVSRTASPATATSADWYFNAINAEESISGVDHWVDYPGFEVDEEAVYITGHMFAHPGGSTNYRVRLWIINKGVSAGFYGGGAAAVTKHDPIGIYAHTTTMPALVYGTGGAGTGIGTYLVSYSGLSDGTNEYLQVIRVNNPLGTPTFTQRQINIGDLENTSVGMPDAPQAAPTRANIETNDRRALDAVWRNNELWFTAQIVPVGGDDAGQATAHWFNLNTSAWPPTLADQGDIGGEDIHASGGIYTFFPSLAMNNAGDVYFGFSASSANIYAGAYCTGRKSGDAVGTVRATETVRVGVDSYQRTFGGPRNRWGDYSGASLDPTDDNLFWIFNEYAMTRGSGTAPEDGRWATAWASVSFVQTDFTNGADATINFIQSSPSPPETDWPFGKFSLNSSNADAILNSVTVNINGSYSGLAGVNPFRLKASNIDDFLTATDIGSDAPESGGSVTFSALNDALPSGLRYYWVTVDLSNSASGTISGDVANSAAFDISGGSISSSSSYGALNTGTDVSLPVELTSFKANIINDRVALAWITHSEIENAGFIVERSLENAGLYVELSSFRDNPDLQGQRNSASAKEYSYIDLNIEPGCTYYYKLADVEVNGFRTYHGPINVTVPDLPKEFKLYSNYPNPFNLETNIKFDVPANNGQLSEVDLNIYNNLGQIVRNLYRGKIPEGFHEMTWNSKNDHGEYQSSGIYFLHFRSGNYSQIRKMLLVK